MFGSGRQVQGQKGQRKVREVERKKHPQVSLIVATGSELQVLLSFLFLFVYVLTSVFFTNIFCPNEAASNFFFFFFAKLLLISVKRGRPLPPFSRLLPRPALLCADPRGPTLGN